MNTKLLLRVKARILKEPKQFQMYAWFLNNPTEIPNCGTAACIAGWVISLGTKHKPVDCALMHKYNEDATKETRIGLRNRRFSVTSGDHVEAINAQAMKLLDITKEQFVRLAHYHMWPEEFNPLKEYRSDIEGTPEFAALAAKRIDHFIATNGEE
jgi:hypothetical protein